MNDYAIWRRHMDHSVLAAAIAIALSLLLIPMTYGWPSSVKTDIPTRRSRPVLLSRSRQRYLKNTIRQRLDVYSRNTLPTLDTRILIREISQPGQGAVCFCGTPSQLADKVFLYLTTGQSTFTSRVRSFRDSQ